MKTLIIKIGATGDVVRTTPLLNRFPGKITWLSSATNTALLQGLKENLRSFTWAHREKALDTDYDLVINLEDTLDVAQFLKTLRFKEIFGAYVDSDNSLCYTQNSKCWFDLSLISSYGRLEADRLKLLNRRTYQELIFEGLGFGFTGDPYLLPRPIETRLSGDVAIAADAGPIWPMKKWAYYRELKQQLEDRGLIVNFLPKRPSLLEHLADVRNHGCLVGGDSLPMHFALGSRTRCVTLFTCTSPWEIYDYGIQRKILSDRLGEFFYRRGYDERATSAIALSEVKDAIMMQLQATKHA